MGRNMTHSTSSSSSSVSSSPVNSHSSLSTDLRLGLTVSTSRKEETSSSSRNDEILNWPPVKPHFRNTIHRHQHTFFVKVYMEGIAVGRKIDLYDHCNYDGLIRTLCQMFKTTIQLPGNDCVQSGKDRHLLTYEDKEGDWMMVGDVPWDLFLTTVKKLKISRADNC